MHPSISRAEEHFTGQIEIKIFYSLVHCLHVAGVRPEAVVDGGEGDPLGPEIEGGEHHMGGVQGVDEVGWEAIAVLDGAHLDHGRSVGSIVGSLLDVEPNIQTNLFVPSQSLKERSVNFISRVLTRLELTLSSEN